MDATIITGERDTRVYQMLAQRRALALEVKTGIRWSNRGSLAEAIRRQHGLRSKGKAALLAEFEAHIEAVTGKK